MGLCSGCEGFPSRGLGCPVCGGPMKSGRRIPGRVSDCWGWWGLEWTRTFRKARGVEEGARAHASGPLVPRSSQTLCATEEAGFPSASQFLLLENE